MDELKSKREEKELEDIRYKLQDYTAFDLLALSRDLVENELYDDADFYIEEADHKCKYELNDSQKMRYLALKDAVIVTNELEKNGNRESSFIENIMM